MHVIVREMFRLHIFLIIYIILDHDDIAYGQAAPLLK